MNKLTNIFWVRQGILERISKAILVDDVDTDGIIAFRITIESNIQQTKFISVSHIEIYIFVEAE